MMMDVLAWIIICVVVPVTIAFLIRDKKKKTHRRVPLHVALNEAYRRQQRQDISDMLNGRYKKKFREPKPYTYPENNPKKQPEFLSENDFKL